MPKRKSKATQHTKNFKTSIPPPALFLTRTAFSHNANCQFLWQLTNFWSKTIMARSRRRRRKRDKIDMSPKNMSVANEESHSIPAATYECLLKNSDKTINYNNNNNNNNNSSNTSKNNCNKEINTHDHLSNKFSISIDFNANLRWCSNAILNKLEAIFARKATTTATITSSSTFIYITTMLIMCTLCSLCDASPCDTHSWWDPVKDKCIECTVCTGDMIPLRPCQLHRDTICGSIYDLKIDWVVLGKTEPNWKERRKSIDNNIDYNFDQQLTQEQLQQLHEETIPLDWQTAALFFAVLACLLFFIVAACILVHHMRQWRRMERRLDQDVEELSTKLMAKLAEVQSLEGGTFFIGNADALRVPTTFQPQHVLLPISDKSGKNHHHHHHHQIHHHERRIIKTLQPGNVYIEENGSKG